MIASETCVDQVTATPVAVDLIEKLRAKHGPVLFHQSGGCCDGSLPLCLRSGQLLIGPNDLLLGTIDGCPVYIAAEQDARWNHPAFVLDVAAGAPEGFSLGGPDWHFVTRTS